MDTDEIGSKIHELYLYYKAEGRTEFWNQIASDMSAELGIPVTYDAARGKWKRWRKKHGVSIDDCDSSREREEGYEDGYREGYERGMQDELVIESDSIYTEKGLLEAFEVDLDTYYVERFIPNIWDGKKQAKAFLRRKTPDMFNEEELIERIGEVVRRESSQQLEVEKRDYDRNTEDCLAVPCLFDAHLSSPFFDGDYVTVLMNLMEKSVKSGYNPRRVLFPLGNDFGHFDNDKSETAKGTQVQSGDTYLNSVDERCTVAIQSCKLLKMYTDHLDILIVPGNHDRFSSYWLGKVLEAFFIDDPSVTVHNQQSPRKYYSYGENLFGFTHGSDEKKQDLVGIMAVEAPLAWAGATHRTWFTGHLHQQARLFSMLSEKFGVIQRIFPALVHPDDWHILSGYVGNDRAAEILLYDHSGKIGEFQFSVR